MSQSVLNKPSLLCVDNDPGILRTYQRMPAGFGYSISVASSASAALRHIYSQRPDIIILSHEMIETAGGELASRLKLLASDVLLILVSAFSSVVGDASHFLNAALNASSPIQVLIDQVVALLHVAGSERTFAAAGNSMSEKYFSGWASSLSSRTNLES